MRAPRRPRLPEDANQYGPRQRRILNSSRLDATLVEKRKKYLRTLLRKVILRKLMHARKINPTGYTTLVGEFGRIKLRVVGAMMHTLS